MQTGDRSRALSLEVPVPVLIHEGVPPQIGPAPVDPEPEEEPVVLAQIDPLPPSLQQPLHARAFLQETIATLGLLIPGSSELSKDYIEKIVSKTKDSDGKETMDEQAAQRPLPDGLPVSRRVDDYHYWRARLLELEKEFEKSEGAGLFAIWQDRRNPQKHATFWIAVWGFIFAVLALIGTFWGGVEAELSRKEALIANSMASVASVAAQTNTTTTTPVYVTSDPLASVSNLTQNSEIERSWLAVTRVSLVTAASRH